MKKGYRLDIYTLMATVCLQQQTKNNMLSDINNLSTIPLCIGMLIHLRDEKGIAGKAGNVRFGLESSHGLVGQVQYNNHLQYTHIRLPVVMEGSQNAAFTPHRLSLPNHAPNKVPCTIIVTITKLQYPAICSM
jgi:hypothetical protein